MFVYSLFYEAFGERGAAEDIFYFFGNDILFYDDLHA
jgi:hypothetical protein